MNKAASAYSPCGMKNISHDSLKGPGAGAFRGDATNSCKHVPVMAKTKGSQKAKAYEN